MQRLQRLSDRFLVVALAGCVGTTAVAVGNGYLPWLGPPALRFARPVVRPTTPLLPPLQMTNPVVHRSGPEEPILPLSADTPGPAESFSMPDFLGLTAPMEGIVPGQDITGMRPARNLLTPDTVLMLLRASGTNAGSSTVVLPAFIPPAQTRAPSSSSSYRSAPVPR
jgi:hypothetical protein